MTNQEAMDVKRVLERGLGVEPPVRLTRDDLIAQGRRRQRRQRAAAISGVAIAAAAVLMVVSMVTSGWFTSDPGRATPASQPPPSPASPTSSAERLSEALRTAPIPWPAEITRRTSDTGPHWYSFRYGRSQTLNATGYEANLRLDTASGYRWLTIDVRTVPAGTHTPDCVSAQSKEPIPNCARRTRSDGAELRVDVAKPVDQKFPTIVSVSAVRPDHTEVDIVERSSIGDGARSGQLMPTKTLTRLALLPTLTVR